MRSSLLHSLALAALSLTCASALAVDNPAGKAKEKAAAAERDLKLLQGTWVIESALLNGGEIVVPNGPFSQFPELTAVFTGEKLKVGGWGLGDQTQLAIELDPTQSPKRMTTKGGGDLIYTLEGDRLKVSFSVGSADKPCPTDFTPRTKGDIAIGVFKRQVEAKP